MAVSLLDDSQQRLGWGHAQRQGGSQVAQAHPWMVRVGPPIGDTVHSLYFDAHPSTDQPSAFLCHWVWVSSSVTVLSRFPVCGECVSHCQLPARPALPSVRGPHRFIGASDCDGVGQRQAHLPAGPWASPGPPAVISDLWARLRPRARECLLAALGAGWG